MLYKFSTTHNYQKLENNVIKIPKYVWYRQGWFVIKFLFIGYRYHRQKWVYFQNPPDCLKPKNFYYTNDFNVVSAVSKELAGESDLDSINVLASCIFENDVKNEQKLMFVLEVFYRIINRLYIKGYAKNVDSFFTEEPIDDDILTFHNLIQEFEDCEILDKFEVLFL